MTLEVSDIVSFLSLLVVIAVMAEAEYGSYSHGFPQEYLLQCTAYSKCSISIH